MIALCQHLNEKKINFFYWLQVAASSRYRKRTRTNVRLKKILRDQIVRLKRIQQRLPAGQKKTPSISTGGFVRLSPDPTRAILVLKHYHLCIKLSLSYTQGQSPCPFRIPQSELRYSSACILKH